MKTEGENNESEELSYKYYVSVNSKMMRYMGLTIDVQGNKRDRRSKILERLPTLLVNIICLMDATFQIQWIADLWKHDRSLVMQITTSGISNIVCICKGFRLAYCREDIQTLFEELSLMWNKSRPSDAIRGRVLLIARNTLTFCKWYIIMMMALGICFALPPLKSFLVQYLGRGGMTAANQTYDFTERVFLVRYPFEINSLSIYLAVLLEEQSILFFSALYWVCCDTLFAQLTTHTSLQFEILRHDIETLATGSDEESRLKSRVIEFVKRHRDLLRICGLIEKIFSPVLLTTMLLTSINICVNLIELREVVAEGKLTEATLHIFHLINIFFQLLVYCIFAERLTQQSMSIAHATYNCKWTEKHCRLRTYFQMLIMKSQRPFHCTAYGFFTIGHDRITLIVNRAMSFYMMLQTTT